MKFIKKEFLFQGKSWYYFEGGNIEGPMLLLIPGFEDSFLGVGAVDDLSSNWYGSALMKVLGKNILDLLAANFHCHHLSRPRALPQGVSIADLAEGYAAFLREKKSPGKPANVIGISMGGFILNTLCVTQPALVAKAAFVVTGCLIHDSPQQLIVRTWREQSQSQNKTAFLRAIFNDTFHGNWNRFAANSIAPLFAKGLNAWATRPDKHFVHSDPQVSLEACERFNSFNEAIQCPTLFLAAQHDKLFTTEHVKSNAGKVASSKYVELPGVAHNFTEYQGTCESAGNELSQFFL